MIMRLEILKYAKKQIDITGEEDGIKAIILSDGKQNNLYIEVASGKSYKLSDDEVSYQAQEYLESEIQSISY
jgi:hypothetical protein